MFHPLSLARTAAITVSIALSLLGPLGKNALVASENGDPELRQRLERFRHIETVIDLIEREYLVPIDRQRLWSGALNGMTQVLDRYSYYTDQRGQVLYVPGVDNTAHGFGFDWYHDSLIGGMVVRRVVPESSAGKAGMVAGDLLVEVNGQPLLGINPNSAAEHLLNASNESVVVVRHPNHELQSLSIERKVLEDRGLSRHQLVHPELGIGLIHLSRLLGEDADHDMSNDDETTSTTTTITGTAFRQALAHLQEQEMQALIIDLRGNGGGSIPAAVDIADCFLSGTEQRPIAITRQRGRTPARHKDWFARSDNSFPNWPLVVLIDGSTASAAEIIASALQDNRRAVIIGSNSQGKDTVQQTFHLENGGALRLTVARFLTPQGKSLQGIGIQPDIVVAMSPLERFQLQRRQIYIDQGQDMPPELQELDDGQLRRAIDVLTALLVTSR